MFDVKERKRLGDYNVFIGIIVVVYFPRVATGAQKV